MRRTTITRQARVGFTLLELMTATVIAALVLVACFAIFGVIGRSDKRMQDRFSHSAALSRTRVVVARAMDTLWMSSEPPTGANNAPKVPPPARVILTPDDAASPRRLSRAARLGGGETPQRLEVVLSDRPLPSDFAMHARPGSASARRDAGDEEFERGGGPIRCAFELRPDAMTPIPPGERAPPASDGWTLWWRPLPLPENGGTRARDTDPTRDPGAIPLISGLTTCTWTPFVSRQRVRETAATWWVDLPAYIELDLKTTTGLSGNWVFEVGWRSGPETPGEADAGATGNPSGESGGAAGATERPAGTRGGRRRGAAGGR
ncbi:MAG: hypothetical protein ACKVU4_14790 [Phycisphaerales bacterium]